jgi:hypothetical protein
VAEIEDIPVRTSGGGPPPSVIGDRLLLGLACAGLLGGVLIAAGNLLSVIAPEGVAQASPSVAVSTAAPTRTPRPSPTPRPLQEVTLVPGEPPEPMFGPGDGAEVTQWIVARVDLPVRGQPRDDAREVGTLRAGEVGIGSWGDAAPEDGWFELSEPGPPGWIRVHEDGAPLADLQPVPLGARGGFVRSLVAGPDGFVARVHSWPRSPWESESAVVSSPDGERWRAAGSELADGWSTPVAWGPAGWLAATTLDSVSVWIFESGDRLRWIPVGSLRARGSAGVVEHMVGSERGYLMLVATGGFGGAGPVLWFSPDGITWQEGSQPFATDSPSSSEWRLLAVDDGFLVWAHYFDGVGAPAVAYSPNGRGWQHFTLDGGPVSGLHVIPDGDGLTAFAHRPSGELVAWRGSLASGELSFDETEPDEAFDDAIVTATAAHAGSAYAFGYDRLDGSERAWTSDGTAWRALELPRGGFGAVVQAAAAGPLGLVVAGAEVDERGFSPVFWHLRPNGAWVREPRPVARDPLAGEWPACGEPPRTSFGFAVLDPAVAVHCFGDRPLTFIAWSAPCRDCWAGAAGPNRPKAWLEDRRRVLYLMPYADAEPSGWWQEGIPAPGVGWDDTWIASWVRITGHYDDPASPLCGVPTAGWDPSWAGVPVEVTLCRRTFVVTEVTVVEGPVPTVP